jgi:ABC-type polar amino acid transport system ATPase subunit
MAINLQHTSSVHSDAIKMLVYGQAGAGKTTLIPTLPNPVILSAEAGLLSIAGADVSFIEIKNMDDLREAYNWLSGSDEAKAFKSVAIDSISEIAEVCLAHEKKLRRRQGRVWRNEHYHVQRYPYVPGRSQACFDDRKAG